MLKQTFLAACLAGIIMFESAGAAEWEPNAFDINRYMGHGVNFGNALEAPKEGEWGVTIKVQYFNIAREADFNSFRIPVCWSAHALNEKPYTIDPNFSQRMDWVIQTAMEREAIVVVTMHHYNELYKDPAGHRERFLAIWKQIAERYKAWPLSLVFEPLNEPHDNLNAVEWNKLLKEVHAVIRQSNPKRTLVFGPANYNDIRQLNTLELPKNDGNIIATAHYYLPYEFTHQGAHWAADSNAWLGTKWTGTDSEKEMIKKDFDNAAAWAKDNNRPFFIGEFGAINKADMDSRVRWTKFVADTAVEHGFSYAYWDYCGPYFGIYDPNNFRSCNKALLDAVIPPKKGH
jgi:endoglucanase